jgi:uncharacterized protein (DUF2141 family)
MIQLKKIIIIFILLFPMPQLSSGQLRLTIEIEELRNNTGVILLEISDSTGNKIGGITENIKDKKCSLVVENLKKGYYAFKYFHDENNNKNLDLNWIGIPREGYGFSNSKKAFIPPPFEKTIFELKETKVMKCIPMYILN